MALTFRHIIRVLGGRTARNIYLWIGLLWFAHSLNTGNEQNRPTGMLVSPWYWIILLTGLVLQMTLVYVNNLVLVPRLLVRRQRWQYLALVFLLALAVSVLYIIGMKAAAPHIRVDRLQQVGLVAGPVSKDWSVASVLADTGSYLIGNLLWIGVFTMAWYMNDYSRQRRMAEQARQQQVATELSFLRSQLNPHFLFNTLNNLYALALLKSDDAPDAILQLSAILRYLLYESDRGQVPFEKEEEIMRAYIALELLRVKDRDSLRCVISADRPRGIPPLLWLPVLENIFKHATRIMTPGSTVDYRFILNGSRLQIYSCNPFRETRTDGAPEGNGIGLANLRQRLALLYPGRHTFSSGRSDDRYITDVTIDLSGTPQTAAPSLRDRQSSRREGAAH